MPLLDKLYENSVTVLRNKYSFPIKNIEKDKIAYVKMGDDKPGIFPDILKNYAEVTEISNSVLDSF
jgi:beta-N-acetylhexosaminidase